VVEAAVNLMDCEEAAGKVYNVGSDEEITIESLADKVIEMTGSKSKKEFISYERAYGRPIEDMMRRVPSLERIKKTVGWVPQRNLTESLQLIIDSFEKAKR
jgi:UDP-glucose 4-epimerase